MEKTPDTMDILLEEMSNFVHLSNNKIVYSNQKFSEADEMFDKVNLTQQQLIIKIHKGGPMQIARIADTFNLKRPNATRLANSLVKLGWCKKIHKDNKRFVYLDLTEKGKKLLEVEAKIRRSCMRELLEQYISPKEQKKLLEFYAYANKIFNRMP